MRETKPEVLREEQEGGRLDRGAEMAWIEGWMARAKRSWFVGVMESKCIAVDIQNCFVVESNVIVIC